MHLLGRSGPVDPAIVLCHHGGIRGLGFSLGLRGQLSLDGAQEVVANDPRRQLRQPIRKLSRGFVRSDGNRAGGQHRARVHPGVHLHEADACLLLASRDGPVDGRRPAELRKQRGVQIHAAASRRVQHGLRQDPSVGHDQGDVDVLFGDPVREGRALDLGRLMDGQAEPFGRHLDGRRAQGHAPSRGPVGLADHAHHVGDVVQRLERGDGDVGGSEEQGAHG
jgi:hypothetical protein